MISKKTQVLWLKKIQESLESNVTKEEYEHACDTVATLVHYITISKAPSLEKWNGKEWIKDE